jgi:DNA-binding CsgD family transcriptional regulator
MDRYSIKLPDGLTDSERTAKFHVRQIMAKLGAFNRAQAVALASRRHLM